MGAALRSVRFLWIMIALFMVLQIGFARDHRHLRVAIEEMPPPPTDRALTAMALGDKEYLFRQLGRWLEMVGDGGGRVRPLRDYDYDRVVGWLEALDRLNGNRSDLTHTIAARYFGAITSAVDTNHERLRKIFGYLRMAGLGDPAHFWPWLVWDADRARKPLADPYLIKMIARDLQSPELKNPQVPAWVRVLPVRLYTDAGDRPAAEQALGQISPEDKAEVEAERRHMFEETQRLKKTVPPADPDHPEK